MYRFFAMVVKHDSKIIYTIRAPSIAGSKKLLGLYLFDQDGEHHCLIVLATFGYTTGTASLEAE